MTVYQIRVLRKLLNLHPRPLSSYDHRVGFRYEDGWITQRPAKPKSFHARINEIRDSKRCKTSKSVTQLRRVEAVSAEPRELLRQCPKSWIHKSVVFDKLFDQKKALLTLVGII